MKILFPAAQKRILKRAALLLAASLTSAGATGQGKEWVFHKTADGQHPSPIEQKMMWLMNRARANPEQEGIRLAATGDRFIEAALNYLNVNRDVMRAEFAAIPAAPPAAFDRRLYESSRLHALHMIRSDSQTHDGQDDLLIESEFPWDTGMLSVFAYSENAVHAHAGLNIDYGYGANGMQDGRGHRVALMSDVGNDPALSNVGLAMVAENNPATEVGPYVFSAAYVSAWEEAPDSYNRLVVGTVWNDLNKNGMYDEGEGLNGVRVELDRGKFFAVTGTAGGFALPVLEAGDYVLTYSGGDFTGTFSRGLEIGAVSVLADAEISSLPSQPVVTHPVVTQPVVTQPAVFPPLTSSLTLEAGNSLTLTWGGGRPPYQVQSSTSLSEPWRNVGEPTAETSITLPVSGGSQFFRIRDSQ